MEALLDNFRDFIARAGFRILQVPDTPQESVGRHLLLAYLDEFVRRIGGVMHIEVQTGRGRMDILITHKSAKIHYWRQRFGEEIVATKQARNS